jgi:hypothetical protein
MQAIGKRPKQIIEGSERTDGQPARAGKRLTVNLGPDAVAALEKISDGGTKSYADIIRDAIWLEEHVTSLLREGGNLYFRTPQDEWHMIVLR